MIRLPPSLESLRCASWLVYATRATSDSAKRIKNLILQIKTDRMDRESGQPIVRLVIERAVSRLGDRCHDGFAGYPILVPVPRAGLTKPHTVWPARRVCEELVRQGLGVDTMPLIHRVSAVDKSAGSVDRPSLDVHVQSFAVQPDLRPPSRIIVVDDVVTSGTTLMGCAIKIAQSFSGVPVSAFALARVQSQGNPENVLQPLIERITIDGLRCRRSLEL